LERFELELKGNLEDRWEILALKMDEFVA